MRRFMQFPVLILILLSTACGQAIPAATVTLAPSSTSLPPTATPTPSATLTPTPVPGVLYVDKQTDLGPISPYIYGSNHGPWATVPADMLKDAFDSHITALRWPGGAWGDTNDIKSYLLDTFIGFAKQMGAIPTVSVRLRDGTPEAAAELVRYANKQMGYGIVYWSIGNEPTLYEAQSGSSYDTVRFNQDWRKIAEAMKAVDPTIKLMGPELHQWGTSLETTPKDSAGRDWMTEFLKANGDLVDVITVHRYPLWTSGRAVTIDEMRKNTQEWGPMVVYLRGLIKENTGRDLPIAFTEVNSSPTDALGGVASPDSYYNAIWYADVLGRLIQQNVFMVNQFILANRKGGLGLIAGEEIRPTYYVFQMYSHFGSELVYSASGVPDVTIYAAKNDAGKLTLMVINLSDTEQQVPLQVQGVTLKDAEVWRFDAEHKAESLGRQPFAADGKLVLPPQSISLFVID
jgi:hypothetical protein